MSGTRWAAMPATDMAGPLMWTRSGSVWAMLRLSTPIAYGSRPHKEKDVVRGLHQVLLRALPGESLLLGVMARTDAAQVIQASISTLDLANHPALVDELEAALPLLDSLPLGERTFWLAVPLANQGSQRWREPARAGLALVKDLAALPRQRPGRDEIEARTRQVRSLLTSVPAVFGARAATVAEQVWVCSTVQHRGLLDVDCPDGDPAGGAELMGLRSGCAMSSPVMDEGGVSDLPPRRGLRANPLARRYLKVTDPRTPEMFLDGSSDGSEGSVDGVAQVASSYQVPLVIADMPAGGMSFPGSEYLAVLDRCGVDVDWAVRLSVTSSTSALQRTRKAVANLNDQYDQRDGAMTTGHHELDQAAELLTEYQAILAGDRQEVQVEHTTYLAVGAPTADGAKIAAAAVITALKDCDITAEPALGALEAIWWQMMPGIPTARLTRQYAQVTTAAQYACAVPFTASRLGDRTGGILAITRSTTRPSVVLHDLHGHTRLNVSGSVAACGELGAGKTHLLLRLCGMVADAGGQNLVIDRSAEAEYARFITTLDRHVILDLAAPRWSMDPLRVLDAATGPQVAHTFITTLTGVTPRSQDGMVLAEVLDPAYLSRHQLSSLPQVLGHLHDPACTLQGAPSLARQLGAAASSQLGAAVFDPALPSTPLDHHVVWLTNKVALPTADELLQPHLFERLGFAKLYGRAYYTLIPLLCHEISRANPHRLTWLTCDEVHALNLSPEACLALTTFIREGRRAMSGAGLGSHDPLDFGGAGEAGEVQRGLIRTRIVLRHTDDTLAHRALKFVGFNPGDAGFEAVLNELKNDTSPLDPDGSGVRAERRGEGWMRDISGGLERIRILPHAQPHRATAADTTPGAHAQQWATLSAQLVDPGDPNPAGPADREPGAPHVDDQDGHPTQGHAAGTADQMVGPPR